MECDLFSSLLAGTGARCFDPRTNATGMAMFDDSRRKKEEENNAKEEEKGEIEMKEKKHQRQAATATATKNRC